MSAYTRERRYSDDWLPDWFHLLTCAFCKRVRREELQEAARRETQA